MFNISKISSALIASSLLLGCNHQDGMVPTPHSLSVQTSPRLSEKSAPFLGHPNVENAFAAGSSHTIFSTKEGVFVLGSDGRHKQTSTPLKIEGMPAMSDVFASYGNNFVIAEGFAQAWGLNSAKELGTNNPRTALPPSNISGINISTLTSNYTHTLAIEKLPDGRSGKLYGWGNAQHGQFGRNTHEQEFFVSPIEVKLNLPEDKKINSIKKVAAGFGFSLALVETMQGKNVLLAWGAYEYGQLGKAPKVMKMKEKAIGTVVSVLRPENTQVPNFQYVDISAGLSHVSAIGSDQQVYTWGDGTQGQLSLPAEKSAKRYKPIPVFTEPKNFSAVKSGKVHTVALTPEGDLYAWGDNSEGQLGRGDSKVPSYQPAKVLLPKNAAADFHYIAIDTKVNHTLAMGNDGHLYGFGSNVDGQLGEYKKGSFVDVPTMIY